MNRYFIFLTLLASLISFSARTSNAMEDKLGDHTPGLKHTQASHPPQLETARDPRAALKGSPFEPLPNELIVAILAKTSCRDYENITSVCYLFKDLEQDSILFGDIAAIHKAYNRMWEFPNPDFAQYLDVLQNLKEAILPFKKKRTKAEKRDFRSHVFERITNSPLIMAYRLKRNGIVFNCHLSGDASLERAFNECNPKDPMRIWQPLTFLTVFVGETFRVISGGVRKLIKSLHYNNYNNDGFVPITFLHNSARGAYDLSNLSVHQLKLLGEIYYIHGFHNTSYSCYAHYCLKNPQGKKDVEILLKAARSYCRSDEMSKNPKLALDLYHHIYHHTRMLMNNENIDARLFLKAAQICLSVQYLRSSEDNMRSQIISNALFYFNKAKEGGALFCPKNYARLAKTYFLLGDMQKAKENYQIAFKKNDSRLREEFLDAAEVFKQLGEKENQEACYDQYYKAIKLNPVLCRMKILLVAADRYFEVSSFEKALYYANHIFEFIFDEKLPKMDLATLSFRDRDSLRFFYTPKISHYISLEALFRKLNEHLELGSQDVKIQQCRKKIEELEQQSKKNLGL